MVLRAKASAMAHIHLTYGGSLEQRVMAVLSAIVWIGSAVALARTMSRRMTSGVQEFG